MLGVVGVVVEVEQVVQVLELVAAQEPVERLGGFV